MKIILNNNTEEFEGDTITITGMLDAKKYSFKLRIIKVNGTLVPRDRYSDTVIKDGDNVQMLYLMSGG
jgi:thiamine biosynthesis protein ThiS